MHTKGRSQGFQKILALIPYDECVWKWYLCRECHIQKCSTLIQVGPVYGMDYTSIFSCICFLSDITPTSNDIQRRWSNVKDPISVCQILMCNSAFIISASKPNIAQQLTCAHVYCTRYMYACILQALSPAEYVSASVSMTENQENKTKF